MTSGFAILRFFTQDRQSSSESEICAESALMPFGRHQTEEKRDGSFGVKSAGLA